MGYPVVDRGLFLMGLVPGDACVVPTLDVYRKNGAPGGRSHGVVVGCRCPSAPQRWPPDGCSRAV